MTDRTASDQVEALLSKGDLSADDNQRLLALLPQLLAEWDRAKQAAQERILASYSRDVAPETAAHLRGSAGDAVAGMSSPDPLIRRLSLYIVRQWYPNSRPALDDLLRIVMEDDSVPVREEALLCIGQLLTNS